MTNKDKLAAFEKVANEIKDTAPDVEFHDDGLEMPTMRIKVTFTDEGYISYIDINSTNCFDDLEAVQYFAILTQNLDEKAYEEMVKLLPILNFYTLFGYFGIYKKNQLFYKYAVVTKGNDIDSYSEEIKDTLVTVYDMINSWFAIFAEIINDGLTCDEVLARYKIEDSDL